MAGELDLPSRSEVEREERLRPAGLERAGRGPDGYGHQRLVLRGVEELRAVAAPERDHPASDRHLALGSRPDRLHVDLLPAGLARVERAEPAVRRDRGMLLRESRLLGQVDGIRAAGERAQNPSELL